MPKPAQLPDFVHPDEIGRVKVIIHLHGGQSITTWVDEDEIDSIEPPFDIADVKDHISDPPKPHWSIIGDVVVFTQAVAAIELA